MSSSKRSSKTKAISLQDSGFHAIPAQAREQQYQESGYRPCRNLTEKLPPHLEAKMRVWTDEFKFADIFPPPNNLPALIEELKSDLIQVPVLGHDGQVTDIYSKIESEKDLLSKDDKNLIFSCLAVARQAFIKMEGPGKTAPSAMSYQWMNWKHTRSEIDQVLEAARLLQLTQRETRDAILASIFSDSIKTRKNFIVHNIHGAQGGALALSYFLNPASAEDLDSIERIVRAVREHQITPPQFMANVVAILISNKLNFGYFTPEAMNEKHDDSSDMVREVVRNIYNKIDQPFNKAHLSKDLRTIDFTPAERQLLLNIGIEEWYVPHPDDPASRIAHAVIAGDHSINYNHPEGFAKIALIRGPDTEAIFEDPTIHHSLDSAIASFADSFRCLRPEVQKLTISGLRRTQRAIERVNSIMIEMFNGIIIGPKELHKNSGIERMTLALQRASNKNPNLFNVSAGSISESGREYFTRTVLRIGNILQEWYDQHEELPFTPKDKRSSMPGAGELPFWNAPLKYPRRDENGQLKLDELTELERRQFKFARHVREIAVELLRAEQWIYE